MVQIIGRLTGDATIKTVNDKEVVNFTIAVNDYYKPKGANEGIEYVEFIQCGYWFGTAIATTLKKGAVVEAGGRPFATAYMKGNDPKGQINMQVQHIKVHVFAKKEEGAQEQSGLWENVEQPKEGEKTNVTKSNQGKNKIKKKPAQNQLPTTTGEESNDMPF